MLCDFAPVADFDHVCLLGQIANFFVVWQIVHANSIYRLPCWGALKKADGLRCYLNGRGLGLILDGGGVYGQVLAIGACFGEQEGGRDRRQGFLARWSRAVAGSVVHFGARFFLNLRKGCYIWVVYWKTF